MFIRPWNTFIKFYLNSKSRSFEKAKMAANMAPADLKIHISLTQKKYFGVKKYVLIILGKVIMCDI